MLYFEDVEVGSARTSGEFELIEEDDGAARRHRRRAE